MKNANKISTTEAKELAAEYGVSVSLETINNWCEKNNIGIKIVGRWYVNRKRLIWLLEGREWKIKKEEQENPKQ